jgi:hypothetical protein
VVPPQALITLNILNILLLKVFLLRTAFKDRVQMIFTDQLKLPDFLRLFSSRTQNTTQRFIESPEIFDSLHLKEMLVIIVINDCVVVPDIFLSFLKTFPGTVHMHSVLAIGKTLFEAPGVLAVHAVELSVDFALFL